MTRIRLTLERMAHGGEAIGRHEGKVIFVPFGIPGEIVEVEVTEDRGSYARGRIERILSPAPERVDPPCPHFGECGGCHFQHMQYEAQLHWKAEIVRDQLRRIGKIEDPPVRPTIPSPDPFGYRNQIQFSASPDGRLGFQAMRSHRVVPISRCWIAHPMLQELYEALDIEGLDLRRLTLRCGVRTGDRMVIFETEGDELPILETDLRVSLVLLTSDEKAVPLIGLDYLTEEVGGFLFRISAPSFFQTHTAVAEQIVHQVVEWADLHGTESVLDAYCGVGLFAAHLAPFAQRVVGIEAHPAAAADARHNLARFPHVEILAGTVEELAPTLEGPFDVVVVDPPRTGCSKEALEALLRLAPRRWIYVSCDPATLARD
ncbi:MAG TPA: 23S rRNA (uracil(1939)-C(5))-methyltransferase RlmD, partial [Thermoflexus sp.]|nr:23S rRNA (uracil(1939)-C(5))-methyltransferase RlmD [Thermoflexus sp.]